VALVEDHVNVEVPPLETLVGLALIVTVGAGEDIDTVTDCAAEPPTPEQVSTYLVAAVIAAVDADPLVGWLPLQPPDAVQAVALVDDQDSAEVLPLFTVVGEAARVTAGAGVVTDIVADWAALPPAPVHDSV
jgi:hypothetical protein